MQKVFRQIPLLLGKKIKYSNISAEHRANEIKDVIDLLVKARVCHRVHHSHCSGLPLQAGTSEKTYKLIFMDIGIANHICGNDWLYISSFMDKELVNEGALAEQFIGQHLVAVKNQPPQVCYWVREEKSANCGNKPTLRYALTSTCRDGDAYAIRRPANKGWKQPSFDFCLCHCIWWRNCPGSSTRYEWKADKRRRAGRIQEMARPKPDPRHPSITTKCNSLGP